MNFSEEVSTKQHQLAENAKRLPEASFSSLAYHIDKKWIHEAYRRTRKDGASGIDEQTSKDFAQNLSENLKRLEDEMKTGKYRAPAVKRAYVPKGNGESRDIGIPTFSDKVLQRAVTMVLEPVFEQDFYDFSYGFRPGRSPHQAVDRLWENIMNLNGCWIIDLDIRKFFDTMDHKFIREFFKHRVCDGVLTRMIGKWLKAGIMEDGNWRNSDEGTPQGGVISPLLSNLYLHHVLDHWFVQTVQPLLKSKSFMIRYADDAVLGFASKEDALRVMEVLPKRFGKYNLTIHPEKTKLIHFCRPDESKKKGKGSFDFLGFTWHWGKSRKGKMVVRKKTAKVKFAAACKKMWDFCKDIMHEPTLVQAKKLRPKLTGHYRYYGVTGNFRCLSNFYSQTLFAWRHWLSRRSRDRNSLIPWKSFYASLSRFNLPLPKIYHSAYT